MEVAALCILVVHFVRPPSIKIVYAVARVPFYNIYIVVINIFRSVAPTKNYLDTYDLTRVHCTQF